jgi:hypothetical protein
LLPLFGEKAAKKKPGDNDDDEARYCRTAN